MHTTETRWPWVVGPRNEERLAMAKIVVNPEVLSALQTTFTNQSLAALVQTGTDVQTALRNALLADQQA
ncbi:hypothetical protein [Frankia sp. Cas3]|uniref:hypothetical protein n=1 Tax=Frankia sp. Cas3 TaxID=3073926 RepID=UPI002AD55B52|nr:hypothetical protein [Frankia sp. Cas3]